MQSASPTGAEPPSYAADLNVDRVVDAMVGDHDDHDFLARLAYGQVQDLDELRFRQEVFRDLESASLLRRLHEFAERMRRVRRQLHQARTMRYQRQREGWFLDAADSYCEAVRDLVDGLPREQVESRGLASFQRFLDRYVDSEEFRSLTAGASAVSADLADVRYTVRIRGLHVEVSRWAGEADYSAEIADTFDRFRQDEVKSYLVAYRGWPAMNHVGARVLDLVARLFSEEFSQLAAFCVRHADFFDDTVRRFERELQFYLTYLGYVDPLRTAGLAFCRPEVTADAGSTFADDTFDLALATRLVGERMPVVCNSFRLVGTERVFVVTGPNQGGKTTFARTFGQLHHFAGAGYPVPGAAARLLRFDRLFTHFHREERLARMTGKLEDDLVRIRAILGEASPHSIVIMNELFSSTTLCDATFLGRKVLERVLKLGLPCVYVTFVDELASLAEPVVSLVSQVNPRDPAQRTYKLVRQPADGLAYAQALADKHGLSYERLRARLAP